MSKLYCLQLCAFTGLMVKNIPGNSADVSDSVNLLKLTAPLVTSRRSEAVFKQRTILNRFVRSQKSKLTAPRKTIPENSNLTMELINAVPP